MLNVVHVNDKLSMDGVNPSSCTHLFGDWIPRLRDLGFACSVCTLRDPDPAARYLEDRGIRVIRLGRGSLSPLNLPAMIRMLREEKAAIAHLHGFAGADFGRLAARRVGVPAIVHEHATLRMPPHQWLADRLLGHWTDAGVAVSGSVRDFMIGDRSVPADRIQVIGNGVDLRRFSPRSTSEIGTARTALDLDERDRVVGTVTRLREEKGTEYFIRAIPPVLEALSDVTFLVAGDGPLQERLERLASDLGVSDRVRFLGFQKDVRRILCSLDVLVIPSLTEGFPLSLIEGMAVGCPVVATRVGGIPEIATEGVDVLMVPARRPDELARRVVDLLKDPRHRESLSTGGLKTAAQHSVDGSARRIADLYRSLLKDRM